ncbi:MAG: cytochrome c oxidase subunit 3 [Kiloniellales bacterium]
MNIFRQLVEKPWVPSEGPVLALHSGKSFHLPPATLGLRVFFCVMTVLFSLLIIAYAERMTYEDWRPAPQQWLLWGNTAALIFSSIAFQWASNSIFRGRIGDTRTGLLAAGLFAVAFLVGQLWAWQQLQALVHFDITNPAIAFFYLITALHGLHVLGGLVALSITAAEAWRSPDSDRTKLHVKLCATYWHFLLAVWLVLFGLLFSGNENLDFLLSICGLR